MEGDPDAARKRERDLKNRLSREQSFLKRQWKASRNGNPYLKVKDHLLVLYQFKDSGFWKYSLDSVFSEDAFQYREDAVRAAFKALETLRN